MKKIVCSPARTRADKWGARLPVSLFILFVGSSSAIGQTAVYPDRPVTLVVGFAAGGFTDTVARLVARELGQSWKQSVIVDNKPGAAGNIAATYVARKPADGYTLLMSNVASNAINPSVYKHLDFNTEKDFEPVILVVKTPNAMVVGNNTPFKTVADLVAAAKAKRRAINYGTPGIGTSGHMTAELFSLLSGVKMTHVPYKGSPAVMMDLINGNLQVTFDNIVSLATQVNAGRARALAVTSLTRSSLLPNVPTLDFVVWNLGAERNSCCHSPENQSRHE
jgi:tripartite-type tricarboxylate transporter receptor subunit TctC